MVTTLQQHWTSPDELGENPGQKGVGTKVPIKIRKGQAGGQLRGTTTTESEVPLLDLRPCCPRQDWTVIAPRSAQIGRWFSRVMASFNFWGGRCANLRNTTILANPYIHQNCQICQPERAHPARDATCLLELVGTLAKLVARATQPDYDLSGGSPPWLQTVPSPSMFHG